VVICAILQHMWSAIVYAKAACPCQLTRSILLPSKKGGQHTLVRPYLLAAPSPSKTWPCSTLQKLLKEEGPTHARAPTLPHPAPAMVSGHARCNIIPIQMMATPSNPSPSLPHFNLPPIHPSPHPRPCLYLVGWAAKMALQPPASYSQ
jgi:hypothetical protein